MLSRIRKIRNPARRGHLSPQRIKAAVENVYRARTVHVMPDKKTGEWAIVQVNGNEPEKRFGRKAEAVKHAVVLCRKTAKELVVHDAAGRIVRSARHGVE